MPLPNLPKVNGQTKQHATVAPVILGDGVRLPLSNFKSISYGDEAKKKVVKDAQGQRTGQWTLDNQGDGEASIEILMDEWIAIKKFLAVAYPTIGLFQIVMDWNVTYGNTPGTQITDKLYGVMFEDDKRESSDNQDALYVKVALRVTGQIIDGATGKPGVIYSPVGQ